MGKRCHDRGSDCQPQKKRNPRALNVPVVMGTTGTSNRQAGGDMFLLFHDGWLVPPWIMSGRTDPSPPLLRLGAGRLLDRPAAEVDVS